MASQLCSIAFDAPVEQKIEAFRRDLSRIRKRLDEKARGQQLGEPRTAAGGAPVVLTARFRTGSTMLWDIFARCGKYHSLYEPFHPDLVRAVYYQVKPSVSHSRVGRSYWEEYRSYDFERLKALHRSRFAFENLWMSREIDDPEMREYLQFLHSQAPRPVVFQFNRVDFRLDWIRSAFPGSPILHLWRNPRDQWLSGIKLPTERFTLYDRIWSTNLHPYISLFPQFPERRKSEIKWLPLRKRPAEDYRLSFLLWLLSMLWAAAYADLSIAYEDLVADPVSTINRAAETLGLDLDVSPVEHIVFKGSVGSWRRPQKTGRWLKRYSPPRPDSWYRAIEEECRARLEEALELELPEVCRNTP